ncbi:hypothetical protein ACWD5Q_19115 [Streptomyces sp. NPDC002513]
MAGSKPARGGQVRHRRAFRPHSVPRRPLGPHGPRSPLSREEQEELRAISTRARITATSFTNTYTLIAAMPQKEKEALLLRLALGPEPGLHSELLHRLRGTTAPAPVPGRRSAARLLDAAHTRRTERRQHAEHERAAARDRRLTALASEAESA